MIYVLGSEDDSTTRYFIEKATTLGAAVQWVELATIRDGRWYIEVGGAAEFRAYAQRIVIPERAAVYARIIDTCVPEADSGSLERSRALLAALAGWLEMSSGRVVNRPGHMLDNGSKPLHEACLLKAGFNVPPSLTSSDPVRLRAFAETHAAIVKSICGIRADCRRVDPQEFADFHPEQGPVHLQKAIDGIDVRVHVVQERAIAVGVRTAAVDYRIADDAEYFRFDLPSELARQVVESTRAMGLAFAGWDFKVDQDGKFYALEANPMPGYHPYDRAVDGAITRALLDHLEEPT